MAAGGTRGRAEAKLDAREDAGHHLLAWSKELQRAQTFEELVDVAGTEAQRRAGYRHAWLYVMEPDGQTALRIAGRDAETGRRGASMRRIPVKGDAMVAEMLRTGQPVVVVDARTDPRTNKQIVAAHGNRTIVNVPLIVMDQRLGVFGVGTLDEEGCREPTPAELDYITVMASHLAVALDRVRAMRERDEAMLEQQRLRERILRAEKLESIGLLAGGVAHDVNNLMTVVLVSLDRALLHIPPDGREGDAMPALEDIRAAATRARDLANRMLALSGRGSFPTRAVCMQEIVEHTALELKRSMPPGIELSSPRVADGEAWVDVEREQLVQMVRNLVANAEDAIGDRSGTIRLRVHRIADAPQLDDTAMTEPLGEGPFAVLEVVDSGAGMDESTRLKLFEPFFTTRGAGRGLGLAVVLGIVRGHQGAIRFTSDQGRAGAAGTRVEVFLPLRQSPQLSERPRAKTPIVAAEPSPTVLLVDDDHRVRLTTTMLLEHRGYRVVEAASGEEALESMHDAATEAHLVMLDLNMPNMGGREVYRRIRRERPDLPVLLCSGYDAGALDKLELTGPTEFLQKPYDLKSLTAALSVLLPGVASGSS